MRARYVFSETAVRAGSWSGPTLRFRAGCYLAEADFSVGPTEYWIDRRKKN